jgi:hypothetical protein
MKLNLNHFVIALISLCFFAACKPSTEEYKKRFIAEKEKYEALVAIAPEQKPEQLVSGYKEFIFYLFPIRDSRNPSGVEYVGRDYHQSKIIFKMDSWSQSDKTTEKGILYQDTSESIRYKPESDYEEMVYPVQTGEPDERREEWNLIPIEGNWYVYEYVLTK